MSNKPTLYDRRLIRFAGLGELVPAFDAVWFLVGAPPHDSVEVWQRATSDLAIAITTGTVVVYVRRSVFEVPFPVFRRRVLLVDLWPSIFINVPFVTPTLEFFFLQSDVELVRRARVDPDDHSELAFVFRESYKKAAADPTRRHLAFWEPPTQEKPLQALQSVIQRLDSDASRATADEVRGALLNQYPALFKPGPTDQRWLLVGEASWSKKTLRSNISKARKQPESAGDPGGEMLSSSPPVEPSTETGDPSTETGDPRTAH